MQASAPRAADKVHWYLSLLIIIGSIERAMWPEAMQTKRQREPRPEGPASPLPCPRERERKKYKRINEPNNLITGVNGPSLVICHQDKNIPNYTNLPVAGDII